jgi:predicted  nucleic acid-binding Zn-ribbon protein
MGLLNEALELSKLDTLSGDKLSDVGQAVTELENVRSKVSDLEQEIKNLKAREEQLENDIIPSFFDTGIQQLTLKDGSKITVKDKTRAHIREDNEDYCFQWLQNQGLDDVIKNQVISTFGRGQDSDAQNLVKELEEKGLHPETKKSVPWNTLAKLCEEQMEKGSMTSDVQEKFGVTIQKSVKIERKK